MKNSELSALSHAYRDSPRTVHPGAWLTWAGCAGLAAVTTTNPFYLLPLFGSAWVVHSTHRTSGPAARSFRIFLLFAAWAITIRTGLVLLGPVDRGSVAIAFLEGLRLGALLTIFGTFNSVADPFRVLKLAPRRFHEPALAAALALSIAPRTIASVERVREAQRLRGIEIGRWSALPALAVPVLATGMDEAVTLAESMDARGHGRGRRTRYRPDPWSPASTMVTSATVAAALVFGAAALGGWGGLEPSTFPLGWPDASLALVAAAITFSIPAVVSSRSR
jgi:energy-coupling factor transport system permease protein